jgi:predicted MFS family arabinose efflux permease
MSKPTSVPVSISFSVTNLLFGLGAGVGAPLGGYISDRFGWRTAFLMQSPILATSLVLLYLKIREPRSFLQGDKQLSNREKLRRIDYLGSLTLVCAIGCLLLGMSLKTSKGASFSDVKVWGLLIGR